MILQQAINQQKKNKAELAEIILEREIMFSKLSPEMKKEDTFLEYHKKTRLYDEKYRICNRRIALLEMRQRDKQKW
ncbi:MAG: hypothetical protein K9J13_13865 [Saprospiraceae bacterium]|nr:hypothetical protein [Saprospiraceae bacterium]